MAALPILYKTDSSPPARAVRMTAEIIGLQLQYRELNPVLRHQDTPELTKKNPMRTVPLLEDGDFCLADSHAIAIYLVTKYGKDSTLYPSDPEKRATVNQRLFFDCGIMFPYLREIMRPTFFGRLSGPTKWMLLNIDNAYRILEAYLADGPWLAGETLSLADVCCVATASSIHGLHPIDHNRFPKTKAWLDRMAAQHFYQKENTEGCQQFITIMQTFWENNKVKSSL